MLLTLVPHDIPAGLKQSDITTSNLVLVVSHNAYKTLSIYYEYTDTLLRQKYLFKIFQNKLFVFSTILQNKLYKIKISVINFYWYFLTHFYCTII